MGWMIDFGPDGSLGWEDGRTDATRRVADLLSDTLAETPDWAEIGIGGGYPRFNKDEDPEAFMFAWALAVYPRSRIATGPKFSGDYEAVRDRVIPATPEGAVR